MDGQMVTTARVRTHVLTAWPPDGIPLVLVHGNASSSAFFTAPGAGRRLEQ
jgi:hypothetical protein